MIELNSQLEDGEEGRKKTKNGGTFYYNNTSRIIDSNQWRVPWPCRDPWERGVLAATWQPSSARSLSYPDQTSHLLSSPFLWIMPSFNPETRVNATRQGTGIVKYALFNRSWKRITASWFNVWKNWSRNLTGSDINTRVNHSALYQEMIELSKHNRRCLDSSQASNITWSICGFSVSARKTFPLRMKAPLRQLPINCCTLSTSQIGIKIPRSTSQVAQSFPSKLYAQPACCLPSFATATLLPSVTYYSRSLCGQLNKT